MQNDITTDAAHSAIIVVDIQEDYTGSTAKAPFPYADSEQLIDSINTVLEAATAHGCTVVYTTQEFKGFLGRLASRLLFKGVAIQGCPGTKRDARLKIVSGHHIPKSNLNAFANPQLHALLQERQITDLYFVGLDGAFCLDKTARAGARLGYTVHLLEDCVVTQFEKRCANLRKQYDRLGIALLPSHALLHVLESAAGEARKIEG